MRSISTLNHVSAPADSQRQRPRLDRSHIGAIDHTLLFPVTVVRAGSPPLAAQALLLAELLCVHEVGIAPAYLGEEEGESGAGDAAAEEDPEHVRRADAVRERVEHERGDDRARLPARGRHPVRGRTELGREHFGGVAVRRAVWG